MQKLTIITFDKGKSRKVARFNIGQTVFVIDYANNRPNPFILEAQILLIGVERPFHPNTDDIIYMLDRHMGNDDCKKYYEKEIYLSRIEAIKALKSMLRKNLAALKEMSKHPYYQEKQHGSGKKERNWNGE